MSSDRRLLAIEQGVLHLRGIVNDDPSKDGAPFLTAGVHSKGKYSFKYGKIRIRARFKSARGAWPALWMLREDGSRPAGTYGEIDLMEHLNFEDRVYQTVHSSYTLSDKAPTTPPKSAVASIQRDDWNTYGAEWDKNRVVFTVNNKPTHTYPRAPELGPSQFTFDEPFYLILSMQIGGAWVNSASLTATEDYPAGMEVDWVRVFKRTD